MIGKKKRPVKTTIDPETGNKVTSSTKVNLAGRVVKKSKSADAFDRPTKTTERYNPNTGVTKTKTKTKLESPKGIKKSSTTRTKTTGPITKAKKRMSNDPFW